MITVSIGTKFKQEYEVMWTTAPASYDYAYVIEVFEGTGKRLVLIPKDKVNYQKGRYMSGLYSTAEEVETYEEEHAEQMLVDSFLTNTNSMVS